MNSLAPQNFESEILLYQSEDGHTRSEVKFKGETVWLSQKLMAELFQKDVRTINEHIGNIFDEHELNPEFPDNCRGWQILIKKTELVKTQNIMNPNKMI